MNLFAAVRQALALSDVETKLSASTALWQSWQAGALQMGDFGTVSDAAGIPARPQLVDARAMPPRQLSSPANHAALIHALAHIEFNAVNLALDAVQRFPSLPAAFYADWLMVAAEEAYHFRLLRDHLRTVGYDYGDFVAHAGLWQMAQISAHDPLVRMALVPRLMEARGLDVTPDIQRKLTGFGDRAGAAILDIILHDEVGHVAAGDRWFRWLCAERGLDVEHTFRELIALPGVPKLRGTFNRSARLQAGFSGAELENLQTGT